MTGVEGHLNRIRDRGAPSRPASFDIRVLAVVQCLGFVMCILAACYIYIDDLAPSDAPVARSERAAKTPPARRTVVLRPLEPTPALVAKRWSVSTDKGNLLEASYRPIDELAGRAIPVALEMVPEPPRPATKPAIRRPLSRFFSELAALEAGARTTPVTIVHLGDSHIASDSLTRGIRRRLQDRFGDAGRGMMVPAGAYKYAVADGVSFKRRGAWQSFNSFRSKSGPYGLSGVRLVSAAPGASLTLSARGDAFDWGEVTVLTGPSQGVVRLAAGSESVEFNARAAQRGSKVVRLKAPGRTLTVTVGGNGATSVLNWAVGRDRAGIRYVNFGLSGATADVTRRWSRDLVAADLAHLKPDLIVWGYGTNEGFNDGLNMGAYGKTVKSFIAFLRQQAPDADLLIVGPSDSARLPRFARHLRGASCRRLSPGESARYRKLVSRRSAALRRWHAPPKLAAVRSFLRDFAAEQNAGFWDWADAMGGECSINSWAAQKLAAGDRVHLTNKGYDRSAGLFVAHLMNSFSQSHLLAATQQ